MHLKGVPTDTHMRHRAWAILDSFPRSPAPSVHTFSSFCNVHVMPEVAAACAAGLVQVGPIRVRGGTQVAWIPALAKGDTPAVSLSICGVLCVGERIKVRVLTVVHLPSQRTVEIRCDGRRVHGFVYAGVLYVAQKGNDILWHAPVREGLAGRTSLSAFKQTSLIIPWGISMCVDTAPCGWVIVASFYNPMQNMFINLTTGASSRIETRRRCSCLGGLTGINLPNSIWVATDYSSSPVCVVAPDGATHEITNDMSEFPAVLPSASAPANLARAAVFDRDANFSLGGVKGQLTHPVKPHSQSLVRLFQNVFLCWDSCGES
eukprot:gnl/Chilomastix_cuspidata/5543.p1 GENE.gnl/Chilomastix_cuspidata/5543~~gnl/Chilomastix_cuspidata/5543.p1  ORF type:complete len:319 (+),score=18.94 gnl/Chilomastix_cuspidata/5543:689-1645(+)